MRDKPFYAVVYMFVVTAFFSSILIGLSRYTRDRVEANRKIAFERAVVQALDIGIGDNPSPQDYHQAFQDKVTPPNDNSAGAYVQLSDGRIEAYAVPVAGKGFWAQIKGIVGVKADKETVIGIAFYEQNETPGLGAEITTEDFRSQFENKTLTDQDRRIKIVPPAETLDEHSVHAVTGATQTSTRLEKLINDDLNAWLEKVGSNQQDTNP